jgi:hypothetical protein
MVPLVVCAMGVATVGIVVPSASATAAKAGTTKTVPVQRLSSVVMSLIRTVEGSTALACETRNSVVRRLRELDDALLSGRRSAAVALASAWRQDAWSMEAARVIGPELGSSLQNRLGRLQGKIGWGYAAKSGPTRHWAPLPSCETSDIGPASAAITSGPSAPALAGASAPVVGSYNPTIEDPLSDLKIFLKIGTGLLNLVNIAVPGLGTVLSSLLGGAVDLLWPRGTAPDMANMFQDLVDTATYNQVSFAVNELGGHLGGSPGGWDQNLAAWQYTCQYTYGGFDTEDCALDARELYNQWSGIYGDFLGFRTAIQKAGDQVKLLPLFAASENLFLPFLSQGVQLHEYWKADPAKGWRALDNTLVDGTLVAIPLAAMDYELDPGYVDAGGKPDRGVGYVNYIYKIGLEQQPAASKDDWGERNAWIRKQTLEVLDFRDIWKYMDPRAYPDGVPGGAKLTRMIWSDSVGQRQATPVLPTNVPGPLKELTIWTKDVTTVGQAQDGDLVISSVQATSPPRLGPAQSGPITGTGDLLHNHAYYKSLADAACSGTAVGSGQRCAGPIISVEAGRDRRGVAYDFVPSAILLRYAGGGATRAGYWSQYQTDNDKTFQYDGEVLATVRVVSHHHWSDNVGNVADAVVFGFRFADSFAPAGQAIGSASGWCLTAPQATNGQVAIHSCSQPLSAWQTWTYDPDLEQMSVTDPAVNPADNLNGVQAKYCLDTAGGQPGDGGTAARTQVVVNPCDDGARFHDDTTDTWRTSSQRWTIAAAGANEAKITNVKSGLVLDVSQFAGQLYAYNGTAYQKWHAHDALTGEIHGVASGKCVDVPDYSTTPGTQVQLYDCHGNAAQQWTYNPANKQLIYTAHPSLCLEVRGGGASGSAVQINTCNGWPRQQWTLHGDGSTISNVESGLVMDAKGGATTSGTLVQVWGSNGTEAQQWSRTSSQGGAVFGIGAGKCLDLPSWNNNTQAVIHSCYTPLGAAQTWIYHPIAQSFTVNSPTGPKCLDTAGGGTAEHTAVVINDCTGAASQRWKLDFARSTITNVNSITYQPNGSLASAMVLAVTAAATADGATVELTQSVGANGTLLTPASNQQWVWSLN